MADLTAIILTMNEETYMQRKPKKLIKRYKKQ